MPPTWQESGPVLVTADKGYDSSANHCYLATNGQRCGISLKRKQIALDIIRCAYRDNQRERLQIEHKFVRCTPSSVQS